LAEELMSSGEASSRAVGLTLYERLYDQGEVEEVLELANKGASSLDASERAAAISLLRKCVMRGKGFEQALKVLQDNDNASVVETLLLATELVRRGEGIALATELAKRWSVSEDKEMRQKSQEIFMELIVKKQSFIEAVEAAKAAASFGQRWFAQEVLNRISSDPAMNSLAEELRQVI
jgi:hypothetical protein